MSAIIPILPPRQAFGSRGVLRQAGHGSPPKPPHAPHAGRTAAVVPRGTVAHGRRHGAGGLVHVAPGRARGVVLDALAVGGQDGAVRRADLIAGHAVAVVQRLLCARAPRGRPSVLGSPALPTWHSALALCLAGQATGWRNPRASQPVLRTRQRKYQLLTNNVHNALSDRAAHALVQRRTKRSTAQTGLHTIAVTAIWRDRGRAPESMVLFRLGPAQVSQACVTVGPLARKGR